VRTAADDITAWCLLAVVIAIVKAGDFISLICYFARCNLCVGNDFIVKPFLKE
jgi:Kef-type K+ transport system membrane component KefB